MKLFGSGKDDAGEPGSSAERVLLSLIAILAVVLVLGTLYALMAGTRERADRTDAPRMETPREGEAVYSRIGTIRASTRDSPPAVVAVSIVFPYAASDGAFKEELDDKASRLREACEAFFSGKSAEELHPAFEGALKSSLRDRLNGMLSLGRIRELWFGDFAVIR